jgi:hypothetical protein
MIPPFDDSGCLPPGVHPAKLDEIEDRFGRQSELRRVQMESVRWMVDLAVRAGVDRIVLNGSFVTEYNGTECAMTLRNERELVNTRRKLERLEALYAGHESETGGGDEELREASMESLKRYINQFEEEIARYEAHQPAQR